MLAGRLYTRGLISFGMRHNRFECCLVSNSMLYRGRVALIRTAWELLGNWLSAARELLENCFGSVGKLI
eukprot:3813545-Lingulodinium_polyedra.AAC.1